MRLKLIAIFIAFSLCVTWFYTSRQYAFAVEYNPKMFMAVLNHQVSWMQPDWKGRILSCCLSSEMVKLWHPTTNEQFMDVFGFYQAMWVGATFALLICFLKEPIFAVFAVFAGLQYTLFFSGNATYMFPWDKPAMFAWTLCFLLWRAKHYKSMVAAIILGTLAKDSVAFIAPLLLFTQRDAGLDGLENNGRRGTTALPNIIWSRCRLFAVAFVGCVLVRVSLMTILGHVQVFTACERAHGALWASCVNFFKTEYSPHWMNILWVNGGLFFAAFMFPTKTLEDKGIKTVLIVFFVMMTAVPILDGVSLYEFRLWTDVLPMLAIYLQRNVTTPHPACGHLLPIGCGEGDSGTVVA